ESRSKRSAKGMRTRPASVNTTFRRVLSNSAPPVFSSSLWTCLLSAGCDTNKRSAALRKWSSEASVKNERNSSRSRDMPVSYHTRMIDLLDELQKPTENPSGGG